MPTTALPYDAAAGTLGRTLTESGFGRAVVANADEDELEPPATGITARPRSR